MHATIRIRLSQAGLKAAILAGMLGPDVREIQVPQEDPLFTEVVREGDVNSQGEIRLDLQHSTLWDAMPTAADVLDRIRQKSEEEAQEKAARLKEQYDETMAVLIARKMTTSDETVWAGGGKASYISLCPHWPYPVDQSVRESPDAVAWQAELDAQNAAARVVAMQQAEADRDAQTAARQAKEQAEIDRRAALGLDDGDVDLRVEEGCLARVPSGCWTTHKRGKNWLAVISSNPGSPGGLERDFARKAHGSLYYFLPTWEVGTAVEFGADYYTGSGKKDPTRWYGYVKRIDADRVVLHECGTGKGAIKEGAKYASEQAARATAVTDQPE